MSMEAGLLHEIPDGFESMGGSQDRDMIGEEYSIGTEILGGVCKQGVLNSMFHMCFCL
jgi:hypothetical protein